MTPILIGRDHFNLSKETFAYGDNVDNVKVQGSGQAQTTHFDFFHRFYGPDEAV